MISNSIMFMFILMDLTLWYRISILTFQQRKKWTAQELTVLESIVATNSCTSERDWISIAHKFEKEIGWQRTPDSCRMKYLKMNSLIPSSTNVEGVRILLNNFVLFFYYFKNLLPHICYHFNGCEFVIQ